MPPGKRVTAGMRVRIVAAIKAEPEKPYRVIGEEFGLSEWFICQLASSNGLQRPRGGVRMRSATPGCLTKSQKQVV